MKDIKKCFGSKDCGWTEDGHYECYCYSNEELGDPPDKLTRISEEINMFQAKYPYPDPGANELLERILDIVEEE